MKNLNPEDNFSNSLDRELRAEQNDDFEQQYLEFCLKESRPSTVFQNGMFSSSRIDKTPDITYTPKPEQDFLQNDAISLSEMQTQFNKTSKNTGSSLMTFFFIRRFLEKVGQKRRKLETLNCSILNLISDKASENLNVIAYAKQFQRKELSFINVQRIFTQQIIKRRTLEEFKESFEYTQRQIFKFLLWVISCIPLIQPESMLKMYWDFFVTFIRGILVFLVPLEISFNSRILASEDRIFSTLIFIVLQLDYFVKINTITYKTGKAIADRWEIIKVQTSRSILIDQCLTFILLINIYLPEGDYDLILILLLSQLKYVYESFLKVDQISYLTRPQRGRIGLIKFLVSLIYIAHLFSCIWFWSSSIDREDSWIITKRLGDLRWSSQYLEAFYFAIVTMLTIGYGDNVPQNQIEKIVTIIFILCACLWFSYSVNFIGGIIDDITQNQVERNKKMRVINKYMREREIPFALQYQIKEYLTYRWKEDDEVDLEMEQELLGQLSDELKEELDKQAYKIFILKCEFLQKYFSVEFRNALFKSIKRKIIQPQNTFSIEFDGEYHLCYIEQGILLYQHRDGKQRSKINSHISHGRFICVKDFLLQSQDRELFKAAGYVSLLMLSKSDFLETLKDFPEDFQKYCQLRDQLILNLDQDLIKEGQFCPVCNKTDHQLDQCSQVQLIPNKELVLKRHIYNQNQERMHRKRRVIEKPIMTRAEMLFVQECARIFALDNPQLIQNQQKCQHVVEQDPEANVIFLGGNEEQLPSVKVFHVSEEYLITSGHQRAVKQIGQEVQSDARIDKQHKPSYKYNPKRIYKVGSIYDHKFLRQNTKSPSLLSSLNEPSIEQSTYEAIFNNEVDAFRNRIKNFEQMHAESIKIVYNQMLKCIDDPELIKPVKEITYLYIQLFNQSETNLDQIYNYEYYFPTHNITRIIEQINKNKSNWQQQILNRFQMYMFYPFQFILKFLKYKRNKAYVSIINKFETIQRARHKMMLLRVTKSQLKRNKVSPEIQVNRRKQI
ncbi:unnamed protein product (macronuclear) [Paramecium tetraurelia]|uniref:Potassium channel domain-containing protein n=1 Tax=Paramecium tetraurelia TaxID=5888 RepID=A0BS55_PARTE|nr:uncharacterized protein GSPATT00031603001 [Paramecium tetraurelia]CAK61372.1 unnamed protein product [Paramecium tetraurelia]|eukprot:XP_001428770.1 hypothetical protein (macronuclear) [Paramecium tetraurelia strain d4-2]